ncbi:AAA family ATPase [Paenibacillus alvei]|uniref:AAA family ATPase n=1 Tax=Paenibacillus alvei TaxID=44250 RepID=UPI0018CF9DDC|nr:AAA family ATPase [Paenibacillus alvei]MBG9735703.1 ATPase [Paenibacillus alvei]MBG9746567.1 ATPase [Paenibacillus alvei]MCY9578317.1 AAA family ATPase [Paenibacillus alvei]MCY9584638.1 AAA family ATPase [Paenibacillus alvei]
MNVQETYVLSPARQLTDEEKRLVWKKPSSHQISEEEQRICKEVKRNWNRGEMKIANILLEGDAGSGKTQLAKALSANFGLPYTKVTCFADMDKSDIIGAILPVIPSEQLEKVEPAEQRMWQAIYESDSMHCVTEILMDALEITQEQAALQMKQLMKRAAENTDGETVEYRFYPSEIVRAFQKGYVLEIQEPNVIRDAAVLMALNSALELDGSMNLPTEIIHRHPDFIAVITTNRSYAGARPLNEALRDRIQHSEKMDLPGKEVMMERAMSKTGYQDEKVLSLLADVIIILDRTARANAIRGVAGMRSFFYWTDAVAGGASVKASLYHKVIYKITTDDEEIKILEEALEKHGLHAALEDTANQIKKKQKIGDTIEIKTWGDINSDLDYDADSPTEERGIALRKSADSEDSSLRTSVDSHDDIMISTDTGEDGSPHYHQANPESMTEDEKQKEREFRKTLNRAARELVSNTIHDKVKLIVHRPDYTLEDQHDYDRLSRGLMPIVREIARKAFPLLQHELSSEYVRNRYYGSKFQADSVAYRDYRYFAKKRPPSEAPSLVVGLRIDESASMSAFGRLEAAKQAVIAVYEFCQICHIPILIYGDTADVSMIEQMSIFAYTDFEKPDPSDRFRLMNIQARSNNRDGMALRMMAERLAVSPQQSKLLISISDGQPKAMDDYTGSYAVNDMQQTIVEYEQRGVRFLAAAIGQDKDIIQEIYGNDRFLDISNLHKLPAKLVRIIARYI